MYSWPSTSRTRDPAPLARNGGYGFQPNLAVRALLPAPPGITSLACSYSSRERFAQLPYRSSNVTSARSLICDHQLASHHTVYTVHTQYVFASVWRRSSWSVLARLRCAAALVRRAYRAFRGHRLPLDVA